jgi:signal transduction histidine kinase
MPDIERAILAAERSAEATSEVLHYSRRRETPANGILPGDILRELGGLLERALDKRGDLELEIEECPPVSCEAAQLETAILNLVINSRDSLGADGRIVVSCKPRLIADDDSASLGILAGQYVAIRVTDNGSGIPEDIRGHVFEPFFTTKPEGVGTGLGLSTVKAFVRRRGGAVWLESAVSEGTTVELLLPAF